MLTDFKSKILKIVKYLQSLRASLGMHDVCKGDTHRITTHLDGSRIVPALSPPRFALILCAAPAINSPLFDNRLSEQYGLGQTCLYLASLSFVLFAIAVSLH